MVNLFLIKVLRQLNVKGIGFLTTEYIHSKTKLKLLVHTIHKKTNSNWIRDLDVTTKIFNFFKKQWQESLYLWLNKRFLDTTPNFTIYFYLVS